MVGVPDVSVLTALVLLMGILICLLHSLDRHFFLHKYYLFMFCWSLMHMGRQDIGNNRLQSLDSFDHY